ncbi:MAG: NUDIX domain-containing protein [Candidatus Berkelbacteria bacterium]
MRTNQRAAIVLRSDDKILFIDRTKEQKNYMILPGGGVESDESPKEAAVREASEELGVKVEVLRPIIQIENRGQEEFYFECKLVSGSVKVLGDHNLYEDVSIEDVEKYVKIDQILDYPIVPNKIKLYLAAFYDVPQKIKTLDDINFVEIRENPPYIPEFVKNIPIIENSTWHDKESVFEHTLNVIEALNMLKDSIKASAKTVLSTKIDKYSRGELLMLSALLHDVAKKDTITPDGEDTLCTNHEEKGAIAAQAILARLDLSEDEKNIVTETIANHNEIHLLTGGDFVDPLQHAEFKEKYKNVYLELVMLGGADVAATHHSAREVGLRTLALREDFYKLELGLSKDEKVFTGIFSKK